MNVEITKTKAGHYWCQLDNLGTVVSGSVANLKKAVQGMFDTAKKNGSVDDGEVLLFSDPPADG